MIFFILILGIIFSCIAVSSCHFIDYSHKLDDGETVDTGSTGLYRYYDGRDQACYNYREGREYDQAEKVARGAAIVAPISATFSLLLFCVEFCCCHFTCSQSFINFGLALAQVSQGLSFLFFDSGTFCGGDLIQEIMTQTPCTVGSGAAYSIAALVSFFIAEVIVFCTPRPESILGMDVKEKTSRKKSTKSTSEEGMNTGEGVPEKIYASEMT